MTGTRFLRRDLLKIAAGTAASSLIAQAPKSGATTKFQLACMTLPYANFPLDRALKGIASAGYKYVAWGTTHQNSPGRKDPVLAADAPPSAAKTLGQHCRGMGLEPVMMFSQIYVAAPDSVAVHTQRIQQAAAAGMPFVLTFGAVQPGQREMWIKNLKQLGAVARDAGVLLVIKQHGGETATGADCAAITSEVDDAGVKICYDAGNVLDYKNDDPIVGYSDMLEGYSRLLHQRSSKYAKGRRLRSRFRRDRPLQTAFSSDENRANDAIGVREHLRTAATSADQSGRGGCPGAPLA